MRYPLVKVLRKRFTRELGRALPHFRERRARSGVRGTTLYEWRATPALTCYVALVVDETRDRFTLELAWSRSGHFPAQLRQNSPDDEPRGGAMRFHLRALWQRHRVEPFWSLTGKTPSELELERRLVDPSVTDEDKVALLEARERRAAAAAVDPASELPPAEDVPVTDALARLGPTLDDVMARLERYAVAYFARVVADYGAVAGGEEPTPGRRRVAGPV